MRLFSGFQSQLTSPQQEKVLIAAFKQMDFAGSSFRLLKQRLHARKSRSESYRVRVFGALFPLHAYLAAFPDDRLSGQKIYKLIQNRAGRLLFLPRAWRERESQKILEETCRALFSEMANVGAGQFALAALWMRSFESDQKKSAAQGLDWAGETGTLIGRCLAVWAETYTELSGKPMQTYQAGFTRTPQDSQGFSPLL